MTATGVSAARPPSISAVAIAALVARPIKTTSVPRSLANAAQSTCEPSAPGGRCAADHADLLRQAAVGHRDPGEERAGQRRADAGDDLDSETGTGARLQFLVPAAEDERVAALEPDDERAGGRVLDEQRVDRVLAHRAAAGQLGGVEDQNVVVQVVQETGGREPVGHHHVRRAEQPLAAHGDEVGRAGPAADERHLDAGDASSAGPAVDHGSRRRRPHPPRRRAPGRRGGHGSGSNPPPDRSTPPPERPRSRSLPGSRRPRRPGARRRTVVGLDAEDPAALGRCGHRGVDGVVVGAGQHVPRVVEVGVDERADPPGDPAGRRQSLEHRADDRTDQDDVGARLDQARHPPRRDPTAADDDDPAPGQAQADQVGRDAGGPTGMLGHGLRVPNQAGERS